jgi:outer membrane lipoprotein LolB
MLFTKAKKLCSNNNYYRLSRSISMSKFLQNIFYSSSLFILVGCLIVLSGCSTIPPKAVQPLVKQTAQQRIAKLEQLQQWKIKGKIAFFEKDTRNSFTLNWQVDEKKESQQLKLTHYLGINVLQLDSMANNHKIQVDGKTYHGENLERLIYSLTGLTLPTQALTFWLKGIPFQKTDSINYQKITQLPQTLSSYYNNELWQVNYSKYQQINGYSLATKFSIKNDNLLIKIVINDWSLASN